CVHLVQDALAQSQVRVVLGVDHAHPDPGVADRPADRKRVTRHRRTAGTARVIECDDGERHRSARGLKRHAVRLLLPREAAPNRSLHHPHAWFLILLNALPAREPAVHRDATSVPEALQLDLPRRLFHRARGSYEQEHVMRATMHPDQQLPPRGSTEKITRAEGLRHEIETVPEDRTGRTGAPSGGISFPLVFPLPLLA